MSRKRLHPCSECKRGLAMWPVFQVCRRCFDKRMKRALDPFEQGILDLATWLDKKLRLPAKGAGR